MAEFSDAEAIWSSGGRTFPVKVLSGPDVQGMVEVGFLWSGQRERVRRGCLSDLNLAAQKLFALVDRFVAVPVRVIPEKPAQPRKKAPPPKVPGAPIEYDRAAFVFPAIRKCHIPTTARLTLLGHADGRVALRAYDRDQHLLGELFYEPPGHKTKPGPVPVKVPDRSTPLKPPEEPRRAAPCPKKSPPSPSSANATAQTPTIPPSSARSSPSPLVPSRRSGTVLM